MFDRLRLQLLLSVLALLRRVLQSEPRLFALLGGPRWQPLLAYIGRLKAYDAYIYARHKCPAYRKFLHNELGSGGELLSDWSNIPVTTKENYVRVYSIEERCHGGRIPVKGVVIDESSGSSGLPNSWVRGPIERASVKSMMQVSFSLAYPKEQFFILNCFALGPWATGMNVTMALVDMGIMKSIGPDKAKLENALRQFGANYNYLIAGYPPFIKSFLDTTALALGDYRLHLVVGGEGISEGLRQYFSQVFKSVVSSYGASDLEINIGTETQLTIALRKMCHNNGELSKSLFGRRDPPMIFQYNPLDYLIEVNAHGELIFTVARRANAAPKIRYNLHDSGGVMEWATLRRNLAERGLDLPSLAERQTCFPILYVYGRSDLSVPFFGAKIFPSNIELLIHRDAVLAASINSFQIRNVEDSQFNRRLELHIELTQKAENSLKDAELERLFYQGLCEVNQDFREISRMLTPSQFRVIIHPYGAGPFADRDIRLKSKYIG